MFAPRSRNMVEGDLFGRPVSAFAKGYSAPDHQGSHGHRRPDYFSQSGPGCFLDPQPLTCSKTAAAGTGFAPAPRLRIPSQMFSVVCVGSPGIHSLQSEWKIKAAEASTISCLLPAPSAVALCSC